MIGSQGRTRAYVQFSQQDNCSKLQNPEYFLRTAKRDFQELKESMKFKKAELLEIDPI